MTVAGALRVAGLGAVLACGACALVPGGRHSPSATFALDESVVRQQCAASARVGSQGGVGTLLVSTPRGAPGFDTPQMAYVLRPYSLDYYAYSRWVDTPSRMLAPLLASCMDQTGQFAAVVLSPSTAAANWRLDSELLYLQQEFTHKPSQVRLGLRAQVLDTRSAQIVAQRYFERIVRAPTDDPYGGAVATNRATGRLLAEVAEWTVAATARRAPSRASGNHEAGSDGLAHAHRSLR